MSERRRHALLGLPAVAVWAALAFAPPEVARGGAYIDADDTNGVDVITHPLGYTGAGGPLTVTVCIDPAATDAALQAIPVQNAIQTWNDRQPTNRNLFFDEHNDLSLFQIDYESTILHELGHCIGLSHANLASESGLSGTDLDYTRTTTGIDTTFSLNSGADGIKGSRDDLRGDDANLHWFRKADNRPFTIDAPVDSSTYSRLLTDLPGLDKFAAVGDRRVADKIGHINTEAVMVQGQTSDEVQRRLLYDDVATVRYAMSGLDELAGTSDDYSLVLSYSGLTTGCDVVISTNNTFSAAACGFTSTTINSTHYRLTSAFIGINDTLNWFFNPVLIAPETSDVGLVVTESADPVFVNDSLTYTIALSNTGPDPATGVLTLKLPFLATYLGVSSLTLACDDMAAPIIVCDYTAAPIGTETVDIFMTAPAASAELPLTATIRMEGLDPDLSDNTVEEETFVAATPGFVPERSYLTLRIGGFEPITLQATGVGVSLSNDGFGGHILTDLASVWTAMAAPPDPVINPFTRGYTLVETVLTNLTGTFSSGFSTPNPVGPNTICPGGCFGGFERLTGTLRFLTHIFIQSAPLSPVGTGGAAGGVLTLTGAPWGTLPVSITGVSTTIITIPERGFAKGVPLTLQPTINENPVILTDGFGAPATTTVVTVAGSNGLISAGQTGRVSLVTPIRITGTINVPGVAIKTFTFIPEPDIALLLGCGVAGLLLLGRSRMRR